MPYFIREFEWYGAVLGLKPVITLEYQEREFKEFKVSIPEIEKNGLHVVVRDIKSNPFAAIAANPRNLSKRNSNQVFVTRKKEYAKKIIRAYETGDFKTVGLLLGYPRCCVERYVQRVKKNTNPFFVVSNNDFIAEQELLWKFLVPESNFLTHYDGRILNSRVLENPLFRKIFFNLFPFAMTDHLPCSISCAQSIKRGVLINNTIKKFNRDWYAKALRLNSNPVLYIDNFNFYILEAESKSLTDISYKSIIFACDEKSMIYFYLQTSDRVKIENNHIYFFKFNVPTHTVKFKQSALTPLPAILPFHRN